jgi:hypothetical protein
MEKKQKRKAKKQKRYGKSAVVGLEKLDSDYVNEVVEDNKSEKVRHSDQESSDVSVKQEIASLDVESDRSDIEPEVSFELVTEADLGNLKDSEELVGTKGEESVDGGEPIIACNWCKISLSSVLKMNDHITEHSKTSWQKKHLPEKQTKSKKKLPSRQSESETEVESGEDDWQDRKKKPKRSWTKQKFPEKDDHVCSLCGAFYKTALCLTKHLQKKHGFGLPFKCCRCNKCFEAISLVADHLSNRLCDKMEEVGSIVGGVRIQRPLSERPYQCRICSARFRYISFLSNHVKNRHTEPNPFLCTNCLKAFSTVTDLTGHDCDNVATVVSAAAQSVLNGTNSQNNSLDQAKGNAGLPVLEEANTALQQESSGSESSKANSASLSSASAQKDLSPLLAPERAAIRTWNGHWKFPSNSKPNRQYVRKSPDPLKQARPKVSPTKPQWKHKCTHCSETFKTQNMLMRHTQKHTKQNAFKCEMCDRTFPSRTAMYSHEEKDHWGGGPFQCKECGKVRSL